MKIKELEEGQKILFNDRKTPLTVSERADEGVWVEGPGGGEYLLYEEDGTALVSKNENKRYSSYVEDLRKVGEWNREEDSWKHSKTGAEIDIVETDTGNYRVESDGIDINIDQPAYGYLKKEPAVEDVEKFVEKHPEGKSD